MREVEARPRNFALGKEGKWFVYAGAVVGER